METTNPVVVSFISGKGGVGKTMLATAFARELSKGSRTLMIDFDFFNRGLTGLLPPGKSFNFLSRPSFLGKSKSSSSEWEIKEIDENLCYLSYPDLGQQEMRQFASAPIDELSSSFEEFLLEAARCSNCETIVIDCHGGPDNSSFAAAIVSDYTLMVTEPDRITLHGTLNFVRQLRKVAGNRTINLQVVFNKVVNQFSGLFLKNFYDRRIKSEMGGAELAAIVPMELYLTKEFEKISFLTDAYPYSIFAKKIRLIIHNLFHEERPDLLTSSTKRFSKLFRYFRLVSTGRTHWFADKDVLMALITTLFIIIVMLQVLWGKPSNWSPEYQDIWDSNNIWLFILFLVTWFLAVLVFSWHIILDRVVTFHARLKHNTKVVGYTIVMLILWFLPVSFATYCIKRFDEWDTETVLALAPVFILFGMILWIQIWRLWRLKFNLRWREVCIRGILIIYILFSPFLFQYIG